MQILLFLLLVAQGVTDDAILIGMEGPAQSFAVDEENLGMRLVIEHVNARGGIHGRRLVEKSYPRARENFVEQAAANVKRLVEEDHVFLLFNFGGPGSVSIGAYAMENDVPYLFPHTALLTVDGDRHVYKGLKYGVPDEHNALLIAAAPELLEAAKRAYAFFELLAEKKAAETGETDVNECMEPEAILLRDVLERAERPQLPDNRVP